MSEKDIKFVMVDPHHVHKTKELDDNSSSTNDRKDPIATAEAMGTYKDIIRQIVGDGAEYILLLKENQGILYQEVNQ